MEVKEAIKLINKIEDWLTNWQDDADSSSFSMDTLYIIDNICKIKDLLQQGEKYRLMWEELKKDSYGCEAWWSKHGLMRYEQKYFPKEIIDEVVKGISKLIKEGAAIAKEEAKQDYPEGEE